MPQKDCLLEIWTLKEQGEFKIFADHFQRLQ